VETNPVVVNGTLYFTTKEGYIYALDAQTGALKWNILIGDVLTSPAVANGIVYIAGEHGGDMIALDASTGTQKWDTHIDDWIFSPPTVSNGMVYIASSS